MDIYKNGNFRQARPSQSFEEPLVFEISRPGKTGITISNGDLQNIEIDIPESFLRDDVPLPELSEPEVVRHFTRLSTWNYGIDLNFYPLGSCTMKYNPRINEEIAGKEYFLHLHPQLEEKYIQPLLKLIYLLQQYLLQITDMDGISLQPAAGAHGELAGIFLIRAYHKAKNLHGKKNIILIPDSAHGTNPASCTLAGYEVKELKSNKEGSIDMDLLAQSLNENVAGFMITNPNTLGIFENRIREIADLLHRYDALLYMDGANYNAIIGKVSLSGMGVDIAHLNLHKTFSTPHGGGGPGAGALVVNHKLKDFLPGPVVEYDAAKDYYYLYYPEKSIGRIKAGIGHTGIMLRALTFLLSWGNRIHEIAEHSVLNANLVRKELEEVLKIASPQPTMHEAVFSHSTIKNLGYETMHLAKTLIDYGYHPPTVYFPLIVPGAIMIEPTETESPETILKFTEAVKDILKRMERKDETLQQSPHTSFVQRVDEAGIAKNLILKYFTKK